MQVTSSTYMMFSDYLMGKSLECQKADRRLISYARMLIPSPIIRTGGSFFSGSAEAIAMESCGSCCAKIQNTVYEILGRMNFNGLKSVCKLIKKIEKKDSSSNLDCLGEKRGGSCVEQTQIVLAEIKKKHGVVGQFLAAKDSLGYVHHANAMITCTDGVLLVDIRLGAPGRLFAIPFGGEFQPSKRVRFIAAASPDQQPIVTQIFLNQAGEEEDRHGLYSNIENAAEIINKTYVAHRSADVPITVYKESNPGETLKSIKVFLREEGIILTNNRLKTFTKMPFSDVLHRKFLQDLTEFMGDDFVFSPQEIYDQILTVVCQAKRIVGLFASERKEFDEKVKNKQTDN